MEPNDFTLDTRLQQSLPFDRDKQFALLGHIVNYHDNKFFLQVKDRIEPEWFGDPTAALIYSKYKEFYDSNQRIPLSKEEFRGSIVVMQLEQAKKEKFSQTEVVCETMSAKYGVDLLARELTDWMRCRIYHKSVSSSAKFFNQREVKKAVSILEEAVQQFQTVRFEGAAASDFSDVRGLIKRLRVDTEGALTTGLPLLDKKINDTCTSGCLLRGDTTVIVAPVNTGKTATLITISKSNVSRGKSVLFISLEGRNDDETEKVYCAVMEVTKDEFRRIGMSDDERDLYKMNGVINYLSRDFTFISMVKPGLTVEEVISVIRINQTQRIARTGKGYDLLVVDYPGCIGTEASKGVRMEFRQMQSEVYRQFVQLALELKVHCLVAAQVNREGSKMNKGIESRHDARAKKRLLSMEDIAESFGIAHSATTVITLNRSDYDQANELITFYVCKSRSSQTGWAVTAKTAFHKSLTHTKNSKAVAYRGGSSPESQLEDLLDKYNGKEIPYGHVMSDSKIGKDPNGG